MPWLETDPMDQRTRFLADHRQDLYAMAELCDRYGISRKTGYSGSRGMPRGVRDCAAGVGSRITARIGSRRPWRRCSAPRADTIQIGARASSWTIWRHPGTAWPAISTVNDLLGRHQLLTHRRRRPHRHPGVVPPSTTAPNDLWTADFKGQFPTGDGVLCYRLTIADQHTRFLLTCHGLLSTLMVGARTRTSSYSRGVNAALVGPFRHSST